MPALTLALLGPPRLTRVDGATVALRSRKQLALLIYLAVEQHPHSRDTLLALLWPDSTEEAARNNLRVALADLRRLLGEAGPAFLQASRQSVQLDPASDFRLDVTTFRALLSAYSTHTHDDLASCAACLARLDEAVALYGGEFLQGFALPDSGAFEEWAVIQRVQLQQQALEALAALAAAHERRGDYAAQCRTARRQIELEPWREAAYAQLMRGLWSSGQRGAALEQYDMCRRVLSVELGIDPSPELTALYEQIRTTNSAEFPALRAEVPLPKRSTQHPTLGTQHAHNLPAQPTSFVGRAAEIAALRQAIPAARLLTLTGTGGCGKTRLALEIASALVPAYPDGVWLVELAPIEDAALVHQAVLAALGLRASWEQPADAFLSAALRAKHLLLVLDNCEHLVPACRQLAEQLLRDCPQLSIMATSREALHVAGEAVWPLPPLSIPNSAALTPDQLVGYDGIQLFVERARAANVGFALTASNAPAVLQLCRRLDSIPLALELAAARVRHMDVEAIAARLDDRFSLLKAGSHAAPRQQTLRAAIDWSYALLTEPERACFRQLAVFAGGFTLEAAEAVVDAPNGSTRAEANAMDLLAQLIDKSLVVAEQRADGMRYRLLETMRAYALDTLVASGEEDALRDRHAAHFLALAELAEPQLFGADQVAWLDRLTMEHANLRAALDWTANRGDVAAALRLVTALRSFWYTRGHYEEGRRRTLETLALPGTQAPTPTRARALNAAGALLWASDDAAAARPLLEEALTIGRAYADEWNIGWALLHLGMIAYHEGDHGSARPLLESGLASCRAAGSAGQRGVGWALIFLGDLALGDSQVAQAQAHFAESVACLRELSDHALLAYPLRRLGLLAMEQGDYRQAAALCTESLRSNLAVDDRLAVAACLAALAAIAVAEGLQATESQRAIHIWRAAQRCGAALARVEAAGAPLWPSDAAVLHDAWAHVAAQLDAKAFVAAEAEGRVMTIEQLLAPDLDAPPAAEAELTSRPHNLLVPLNPCIGRDAELSELVALAQTPDVRLLTLVGVGGMGKTRLALEIGHACLPAFADGVFFVPLAPLVDAAAIVPAITDALEVPAAGVDLSQALLRALRAKRLLLILDNFEHLLNGASIVTDILQSAPQVKVIVTSRERLNVRGERPYLVQGLTFPLNAAMAEAAEAAAVRLFVQNAQRVRPTFTVDEYNIAAVLRICQLVEGMPLGLELAATWTESLSPADIAAEIEQSADFLAVEWRDLPERQRSMRAVFDWSWRLLSDVERQVFKQLAIFRGGFTRQAAQAIVGGSLVVLTGLTHKALLRLSVTIDGATRYELHELLRQLASERLSLVPEEQAAVAARHAAFYLQLAERGGPTVASPAPEAWFAQIARDHDNLRAALAWAQEDEETRRRGDEETACSDKAELGLRLAGALWPFWERYCHLSEGRRWLEGFLESAVTIAPEVRATALIGAASLAHGQDDYARADALFAESLRLEQALGRTGRVAAVLAHRGMMLRGQGQYAEAIALLEESLALARAGEDRAGVAYALFRLGGVTRERGDYARATRIYEECLDIYQSLGDRTGVATALLGLGDIGRDQGDAATLEAYCVQALAVGRELRHHWITGFALNNLAQAATMRSDYAQALPLAEEGLALFRAQGIRGGEIELLITIGQIACAQGDQTRALTALMAGIAQGWSSGLHELVATGLEELARVAGTRGDAAFAANLCAATTEWRAQMGAPVQPYRLAVYEATLTVARGALGANDFAAAWAEGTMWQPEQAIEAGRMWIQAHAQPSLASKLAARRSLLAHH